MRSGTLVTPVTPAGRRSSAETRAPSGQSTKRTPATMERVPPPGASPQDRACVRSAGSRRARRTGDRRCRRDRARAGSPRASRARRGPPPRRPAPAQDGESTEERGQRGPRRRLRSQADGRASRADRSRRPAHANAAEWIASRNFATLGRMSFVVAVVGATGAVGREMLRVLEQRAFPLEARRRAGEQAKRRPEAPVRGRRAHGRRADAASFAGVQIALFSAGASVSREYGPIAAAAGAIAIDNSSAWRMDADVPLVVPEVNMAAAAAPSAGHHRQPQLLHHPDGRCAQAAA